jgi:hypothetical protein
VDTLIQMTIVRVTCSMPMRADSNTMHHLSQPFALSSARPTFLVPESKRPWTSSVPSVASQAYWNPIPKTLRYWHINKNASTPHEISTKSYYFNSN